MSVGKSCKIRLSFFLMLLALLLNASLLSASALAITKQGHMKLLAVRETEGGHEGGIADLYLEIKPGSGRVFLETFPLTRTDTQMSTRFAKAIACDIIERDCDELDFFYTITANSAIIAGPSAGASIAILTAAMLEDLKLDERYAVTGTINSGGLIGPVGGLRAKVEAAKMAGLEKVFIPAGELMVKVDNTTTDLKNLSKGLNIQIIEVSTLSEALKEFTGKELRQKYKDIDISEEYKSTMKSLAKGLCDRSNKLKAEAKSINLSNVASNASALMGSIQNLTTKGREAFERQAFYSSASYCFGANVELSTLLLLAKNLSKEDALKKAERLVVEISSLSSSVEKVEKKTITDLEAYIVIKERLAEASESVSKALEGLNNTNRTEWKIDLAARTLAYASERINSAKSWANFLGKKGKAFNLNMDVLKKSCQNKISEADERMQYVEIYIPNTLGSVKKEIDKAGAELEKGNYEICLSTASKAKADVDIILSVFGVEPGQYQNIVDRKLAIVKNNIARQAERGIFPILGYSYYEYANSLKQADVLSALLYSEYSLELGNLDIYFKESNGKAAKRKFIKFINIDKKLLGIFIVGVLTGILAAYLVKNRGKKVKDKRKGGKIRTLQK